MFLDKDYKYYVMVMNNYDETYDVDFKTNNYFEAIRYYNCVRKDTMHDYFIIQYLV